MRNYWKRNIADPIKGLTLDRLSCQIDAYQNGYLGEFARTAEAMEIRDDILKNVITKRKKAVARHGWEILTEDCSKEALAQQATLDFFYRNLTCSNAVKTNERGGFQLLIHQMMDAIGKGYAVHEIIWKPIPIVSGQAVAKFSRSAVTAEFRFVPLWYFESTCGRLRFLKRPGDIFGEDLRERDWLVTVGDGLMLACSRAFLFKHYPLQAWLDFSQRFGLPGVKGATNADRGTTEFEQMSEALKTFLDELAVVTNSAEAIDVIDLKGSGQPPFAELVERMDRVMSSLWRGADLSTLSRDRGYGATLQEQEARILEQDDARMLSEQLNTTVDRWVLEQFFGRFVQPLARLKILVSPQESTPHDLAIDSFLLAHGAKLPLSQTLERYGRVEAKPDEPFLEMTHSRDGNCNLRARTSVSTPELIVKSSHGGEVKRSEVVNSRNFNLVRQNMKAKLYNSVVPNDRSEESRSEEADYQSIQLSPIGLFPHVRGYQNVDRASLETLVRNFKSFFGRLGRRFAGIPLFIGHPDVPGFEGIYTDRKAYGWIMDLFVSDDGLYGKAKWSSAGRDLIANRHYKFLSPYWEALRIGSKDGRNVYSPSVLKSVGLTNEPNLPVLPLANSQNQKLQNGDGDEITCLGAFVSLSDDVGSIASEGSGDQNLDCEAHDKLENGGPSHLQSMSAENRAVAFVELRSLIENEIAKCRNEISDLNRRLIQTVLDNAIADSRILPIERSHWTAALAKDFETASTRLANTVPVLQTSSRATVENRHSLPGGGIQKQEQILSLVEEEMKNKRENYHNAWLNVQKKHPELFV